MKTIRYLRGILWMVRRFGPIRTFRYEQVRRSGMTVDYVKLFSPETLAKIGEHFDPAPWESR